MKETVELDFKEIFGILKKKALLIVVSAVLVCALVLLYTAFFVTPMYTAQISVVINNQAVSSGDTGYASSDLAVAIQLANTYVEIIKEDVILKPVIEEYDLDLTTDQLRGMISAEVIEDTQLFKVKIESDDRDLSEKICKAVSEVATREIPGRMQGSSPTFLGDPKVSDKPTSPNYVQNAILGFLAGAVLAVIAVIAGNLMDVRIKGEDDLEKICPIPVLGMIPNLTEEPAAGSKHLPKARIQKGGKR